jgi:hypothetical protein
VQSVREYLAKIGKKGGKARLKKMTAEQRKAVARKAAQARWAKAKDSKTGSR